MDKNNCILGVRYGKEWEGTGKPQYFFGGCSFRKGKYLGFCRESVSQCGGQGFEPLCSTNKSQFFNHLHSGLLKTPVSPSGQYMARNNSTEWQKTGKNRNKWEAIQRSLACNSRDRNNLKVFAAMRRAAFQLDARRRSDLNANRKRAALIHNSCHGPACQRL